MYTRLCFSLRFEIARNLPPLKNTLIIFNESLIFTQLTRGPQGLLRTKFAQNKWKMQSKKSWIYGQISGGGGHFQSKLCIFYDLGKKQKRVPRLEPGTHQLKTQHTTTEPQSPVESHRSNRPKSRTKFFGLNQLNCIFALAYARIVNFKYFKHFNHNLKI